MSAPAAPRATPSAAPELQMAFRALKIGQSFDFVVAGAGVSLEILCLSGKPEKGTARIVARDGLGNVHILTGGLENGAAPGEAFKGSRVDVALAENLARAHLNGKRLPGGATLLANTLAAAVLQLQRARP